MIDGLYNLVSSKIGSNDELATASSTFGKMTENWQGVDINAVARLRNGLTIQGGTSTGRRLQDACDVRANLVEYGAGASGQNNSIAGATDGNAMNVTNPYCRIEEPYRTEFKGLATYLIPKANVQVSGTWASVPGDSLAANYTVTPAIAAASSTLGRPLAGGNQTVNLIAPATFWAERRNNIDFRVAKIFRFGRTRSQVGVDVYNLTNTDVVTTFNQTFTSTSWLTPTAIQPARYVKLSAQFDF
jgi:hypothetical protein